MRLHTIFEGGPANGVLVTVDVGTYEDEDPPTEMRVVREADLPDGDKVNASVYRLVGAEPSPIPRQRMATYRYSHDYNDLPISLIDAIV